MMMQLLGRRLLAATCVVGIGTSDCADRRPPSTIAPVTVPFELRNDLPVVHAKVNGVDLLLVLDSGSGALVLDSAAAHAAHVRIGSSGLANGRTRIAMGTTDSLSVGGAAVYDALTAIVDMTPVQRHIGYDVRGTIGYDFFRRYVITVDYAAQRLTIAEPRSFHPDATLTALPIRVVDRLPVVSATIETRTRGTLPVELHVDLGSSSYAIRLSRRFLARFPLEHDTTTVPVQLGAGVGGVDRGLLLRLPAIQVGTLRFARPSVALSLQREGAFGEEATADGTIGAGILRRTKVTFDYEDAKLYLERLPAADTADSIDASGLTLELADSSARRWTVQDVVPGSAAAIAGIEPGDEVLALDRKPIETFALAEIRARLRQSGTSCAIVVERAGERLDRVMRLRSLV